MGWATTAPRFRSLVSLTLGRPTAANALGIHVRTYTKRVILERCASRILGCLAVHLIALIAIVVYFTARYAFTVQ